MPTAANRSQRNRQLTQPATQTAFAQHFQTVYDRAARTSDVLQLSLTQNALIRFSVHGVHPVNRPHQPAKGMASPVIRNSHCRAGCIERCSPRSTEAQWSNLSAFVLQASNPIVLSDGHQSPERGRCGQTEPGIDRGGRHA